MYDWYHTRCTVVSDCVVEIESSNERTSLPRAPGNSTQRRSAALLSCAQQSTAWSLLLGPPRYKSQSTPGCSCASSSHMFPWLSPRYTKTKTPFFFIETRFFISDESYERSTKKEGSHTRS